MNRLGQLNGLMPRYFAWKLNASRTRGSSKERPRSASTVVCGRTSGSIAARPGSKKSRSPDHGRWSTRVKAENFLRFSSRNSGNFSASAGLSFAISAAMRAGSGVQSSVVSTFRSSLSKSSRYCGSRRVSSTPWASGPPFPGWSCRSSPHIA